METATITAEMTLREAAPLWLESRKPYISEKTHRDYKFCLKALNAFFGALLLSEIDADQIRAFQRSRWGRVGPSMINQECSIVQQMLKQLDLWKNIAGHYEPLRLPHESRGRALTEQEEYRLFRVASLNPNWEVCYNAALLSAHTAAGPGEIMRLQLRDVFLGDGDPQRGWIKIREGAKNNYRVRSLPLDREAFEAVQRLHELAIEHGAHLPEHYLLPFSVHRNTFDPLRHQTTFKTAWREMLTAADISNFRFYDLRHHCASRLAETQPEHVLLKILGHASTQMVRKVYSHVRDAAVLQAINSLSRPEGWKPKAELIRKLTPKIGKGQSEKVISIVRKAKQIAKDAAPEDTSWIELAGGETEVRNG